MPRLEVRDIFCKEPDSKYLRPIIAVVIAQLCRCVVKASIIRKWKDVAVALFQQNLFTKHSMDWICPVGQNFLNPGLAYITKMILNWDSFYISFTNISKSFQIILKQHFMYFPSNTVGRIVKLRHLLRAYCVQELSLDFVSINFIHRTDRSDWSLGQTNTIIILQERKSMHTDKNTN